MDIKQKVIYEYGVLYNNEKLVSCGNISSLLGVGNVRYPNAETIPFALGEIYKFSKEDGEHCIEKGRVIFDVEDNLAVFKEEWTDKLRLNSKSDFEDVKSFISTKNQLEKKSTEAICEFIANTMFEQNKYVYDTLLKRNIICSISPTLIRNLLAVTVCSLNGMEKVLKSEHKNIVLSNLNNENFYINNDGELTKVLGLPKFVLDYTKGKGLDNCFTMLRSMVKDLGTDDMKTIIEFFDIFTLPNGIIKTNAGTNMYSLIDKIYKILLNNPEYKAKPLLNYLIRQEVYFEGTGSLPVLELQSLYDYLEVCHKWEFEIEKYPSILKKAHDVVIKNAELMKQEHKAKDFEKMVKSYKNFQKKGNRYSILIPTSIENLIEEGNALNHCVGSYVDRVINGSSKILFVRRNEELNKPFVTFELNKNDDLVQIRGKSNSTPIKEVIDFVNERLGKPRRNKR